MKTHRFGRNERVVAMCECVCYVTQNVSHKNHVRNTFDRLPFLGHEQLAFRYIPVLAVAPSDAKGCAKRPPPPRITCSVGSWACFAAFDRLALSFARRICNLHAIVKEQRRRRPRPRPPVFGRRHGGSAAMWGAMPKLRGDHVRRRHDDDRAGLVVFQHRHGMRLVPLRDVL